MQEVQEENAKLREENDRLRLKRGKRKRQTDGVKQTEGVKKHDSADSEDDGIQTTRSRKNMEVETIDVGSQSDGEEHVH